MFLLYATLLAMLAQVRTNFTDFDPSLLAERRLIVGGEPADITEFPHQISLRYNGYHVCGGSVYKSNVIITAAHCVFRCTKVDEMQISAGSIYWAKPQQLGLVKKCISHENFDSTTVDYDVAILVLDTPLNFSSHIQPIRLAEELPAPGSKVTVSGWGRIRESGPISDHLQKVDVEIVNDEKCREANVSPPITDRMFCAGVEEGGKDACSSDSGGPVINTATGELLGIVSFGVGCARPGKPGVYASVPYLHNWIVDTVEDNVN